MEVLEDGLNKEFLTLLIPGQVLSKVGLMVTLISVWDAIWPYEKHFVHMFTKCARAETLRVCDLMAVLGLECH